MTRAARTIPRRRRVFIGCEGESERSYVAWLREVIDARQLGLHFDAVLLKPGAGDPLKLVELACKRMREGEHKHGIYRWRAVLLDADRRDEVQGGRLAIERCAREAKLRLIWQDPTHEAFLLRHLPGCETLRPPTQEATMTLRKRWPGYEKSMPAVQLRLRLDRAGLARALTVEWELAAFLAEVGFSP